MLIFFSRNRKEIKISFLLIIWLITSGFKENLTFSCYTGQALCKKTLSWISSFLKTHWALQLMLKFCPQNLNLTKYSAQNNLCLPNNITIVGHTLILWNKNWRHCLPSESQDFSELCFSTPFLEQAEQCAVISLLLYVNNLHMFFKKKMT